MVDRADMRAADDDRERVTEMLRDAHGAGRLSQEELLERIEKAYEARTFRDLDRLIADLPVQRSAANALTNRPRSAAPVPRRRTGRIVARKILNFNWYIYGGVVALCTMIWLITAATSNGGTDPWPLWVAGPWGVFLGFWEVVYRSTDSND